jgi:4-hydroxythreonine-4-phosphate dehydrogenase
MYKVAVTPGEPAGIGPDVVLLAAQQQWPFELVAIANLDLLRERAAMLKLDIQFQTYDPDQSATTQANTLTVLNIPLRSPVTTGSLNKANAYYVLETLQLAVVGALEGKFSAIVTGPIHKGIMNDAGIKFSGHTEYLRDMCEVDDVVMLLTSEKLSVALATTHIPLAEVPKQLSQESLVKTINIIDQHWLNYFYRHAKILVAGLNPHAGENGHLGREDQTIIAPACLQAQSDGLDVQGPLSADTMFHKQADVFLAMYHDQGLPVLKYASFGHAANITLGLPFIRASVDHGTALALAGSGKAKAESLVYALQYTYQLLAGS